MTNENGKVKRSRRDTARRVRNIHYVPLCIGGHGMPCPYKLSSVICTLSSVLRTRVKRGDMMRISSKKWSHYHNI